MHCSIYKARPKVQCIIHTHSPYATALSVLHQNIPVIIEEMVIFLGGEIQCTDYTQTGTTALGDEAVKKMGMRNAVLIANHGVIVVGKTPEYCIRIAILVEKMAQIFLEATKAGDVITLPKESIVKLASIFNEKYSTL